jgi:methionyl-tRNA formyltransferase
MTPPLKIIFAGSGEFGSPTLRMLVEKGFEVVQVFTQPDRPAGRGKKLTATPIAQLASELGLTIARTGDINTEQFPVADVLLVIAFGQKIGEAAVHHPRLGSINLHASRLPLYRGAAPINWAILNGEKTTGNSIIRLANKMDAGAILGQSELIIGATETAGELHDRLAIDGAPLVHRVLIELAAGTIHEQEQNHSLATQAPKLSRETATLDWSQPAQIIALRINGLSPWPGCRVRLVESNETIAGRLTLLRAQVVNAGSNEPPGHLNETGTIAAGDGQTIQILDVQPEGKRPMSLTDYRRGNPWPAGSRLESI